MKHLSTARRRRAATSAAGLLLALLLALLSLTNASAQARRDERAAANAQRPRLVLLVVVDQFRYDYLERFGDLFGAGGLRRLQREGATWVEANYDHIPTETAPGHATLMTGAWPAETGIIANEWYLRDEKRRINNVQDDTAKLIGGVEGERASSPRNLLVSTVGDELRLASNRRSKVIGISVKDRGAILPSGRMANAAYWYSSQTGQFVSSTYYFNQMPEWVTRFNAARPADKYFGARWERLAPLAEYERRAGRDDAPWEKGSDGKTPYVFPHVVTGGADKPNRDFYDALTNSPFSNDLLLSFAEQALLNEGLGADADTDVLSVSFSANDIVGHRFGPYSQEVMDMTLRVDRQIEQLLNVVDARVGLRNTIVIFTADHGVAPVPEHASELGLPGGRVKVTEMMNAVRNRFKAYFKRPAGGDENATNEYVQTYSNGQIYLNRFALERDGISREEAERVAGEAALTVPGVARFFTRTQLAASAISSADPVARRALHGFYARRSGDVVIIQEPFKYLTDYPIGATHGAPYSYDTHVPLIIMGGGLAPGRYSNAATPADIAPTLARLLRVQAPSNAMGRILLEAIR
jgi:predicted AlkP superfamily pyrophosphatase or phosphodiesterase